MENKIYSISVDSNKCSKCGICSSLLPAFFAENTHGDISILKRTITDREYQEVVNVSALCIKNAINIDTTATINETDYTSQISMLINKELSSITTPKVEYSDYKYDENEIEFPITFNDIHSPYKYLTDISAESAGYKELKQIFDSSSDAVVKGTLFQYKHKKINRFIDRNNFEYFYKETESNINNIICIVNKMLWENFTIKSPITQFIPDLSSISEFTTLSQFEQYAQMTITMQDDVSCYIGSDYRQSTNRYCYELLASDIQNLFSYALWDLYDKEIEVYAESLLQKYNKTYTIQLITFVNDYRSTITKLLPSLNSKDSSDTVIKLKAELKKLNDNFIAQPQKTKTGKYVSLDTSWDSDNIFVFRRDAEKAAERRTSRMEHEYNRSFYTYCETLGETYASEICENTNEYLRNIQNLFLRFNRSVPDIIVNVKLGDYVAFSMNINDAMMPENSKDIIRKYITDIATNALNRIDTTTFVYYTIDDCEIYIGESIFGNSKFSTKYNYFIDDTTEILHKMHTERDKLNDIIYDMNLMKMIYKHIVESINDEGIL